MDPLSHAMVGATVAALRARKKEWIRPAVICGLVAGMSPDLDIVIRDAADPMFGLGFHRHFTHSLAFAPFGALLVAGFLWCFLRRVLPLRVIYGFCIISIAMHGVLDAMTNYGTHLFWPFLPRRESWSIISIIDPIFTLALLGLLMLTLRKRARKFAVVGACFALVYWSLGFYQREQATQAMHQLAGVRGHTIERFEVKPSFGNLFAWRGQYQYQGRFYIDAFHVSPWKGQVVYEGGSLQAFVPPESISPVQQEDLGYFTFFSDGWLAYAPAHEKLIGDVRFSMLPNQLDPIWGIYLRPEEPQAHVRFANVRQRRGGDVAILWEMIKGNPL